MPMIDAAIHNAVMALPPDERRDRAKVNEARSESDGIVKKPAWREAALPPKADGSLPIVSDTRD